MTYSLFYNKSFFILIILILLFSLNLNANIDNKAKEITSKLRCMTCQNQTIYSSDAEFSLTIKKIVKEKLENKKSEKEIIDFLIHRYGEYIIFEPKFSKQNIFLWFFPFIILVLSLVFLILRIWKNK